MKTMKKEVKQTKAEAIEAVKAMLPELNSLKGKALSARVSKLTEKERDVYKEVLETATVAGSLTKETLKAIKDSQKRMEYRKEIAQRDKELQYTLAETLVKELKLKGKTVAEINKSAKMLKQATGTTRNQSGSLKRECGFKPVKDTVTGKVTWVSQTTEDHKVFVEAKRDSKVDWKHKLSAYGF